MKVESSTTRTRIIKRSLRNEVFPRSEEYIGHVTPGGLIVKQKKALPNVFVRRKVPFLTGCGSAWLERSVRDAEAARSNRAIPTRNFRACVSTQALFPFFISNLRLSLSVLRSALRFHCICRTCRAGRVPHACQAAATENFSAGAGSTGQRLMPSRSCQTARVLEI